MFKQRFKSVVIVSLAVVIIGAAMPTLVAVAHAANLLLRQQHDVVKHSDRYLSSDNKSYSDVIVHRVTFADGTSCVISMREDSTTTGNTITQNCSFPENDGAGEIE